MQRPLFRPGPLKGLKWATTAGAILCTAAYFVWALWTGLAVYENNVNGTRLQLQTGAYHWEIPLDGRVLLYAGGALLLWGLTRRDGLGSWAEKWVRPPWVCVLTQGLGLAFVGYSMVSLYEDKLAITPQWLPLLGLGVVAGTWLLTRRIDGYPWPAALTQRLARMPRWALATAATLSGSILATWMAFRCYEGVDFCIDSQSQTMQARLILQGLFTVPISQALRDVITLPYFTPTLPVHSQFPPGYIAALMIPVSLGINTLWLNVAACGLTVALTAMLASRMAGRLPAVAAVILLLGSSWLTGMCGTAMNHMLTGALLTGTLVLVLAALDQPTEKKAKQAALLFGAGFLLGWAADIRPLTAFSHGVAYGVAGYWAAASLWRKGTLSQPAARRILAAALGWPLAGLALPALLFLAYNRMTTGQYFLTAYQANAPGLHLGFMYDGPYLYTLRNAIDNFFDSLLMLDSLMLGWMWGGCWLLLVLWWVRTRLTRAQALVALVAAAQWLAYRFYYWHDHFLGPRFVYESLPMLAALAACGMQSLKPGRLPSPRAGFVLVIFGLVALFCLVNNTKKWEDKMASPVFNTRAMQAFANQLDPAIPTVVVMPKPFHETNGPHMFKAGNLNRLWFVMKENETQARGLEELQGFKWMEFTMGWTGPRPGI